MRRIVYGPTVGTYECQENAKVPTGKPRTLLVRVHAVGLNPVDAKVVVGDKLPRYWTRLRQFVHANSVAGHVPGFDFAGTVVQSGTNASTHRVDNNNSSNDSASKRTLFAPSLLVEITVPQFS